LLGVKPLTPEESFNITLGIGAKVREDINVTFDYYDIFIDDRIVISNRVPFTGGEVEFFTNSIDTKTSGLDVVIHYQNTNTGLGLSFAGNFNLKNERDGDIPTIKDAYGDDVGVIDSTQEALFFTSRPKQKFVVGATYQMEKIYLALYGTYFGSTEFKQAGMDPNLKTVFESNVVFDLAVTYDLFDNVSISANVNNLLDVTPKWNFETDNNKVAGQLILDDPEKTKVQSNLITFNGRYDVMTYDGYHFSQLGRIYSLSLTYKL